MDTDSPDKVDIGHNPLVTYECHEPRSAECWQYCHDHPGVSTQAQVSSPFYPGPRGRASALWVALQANVFISMDFITLSFMFESVSSSDSSPKVIHDILLNVSTAVS